MDRTIKRNQSDKATQPHSERMTERQSNRATKQQGEKITGVIKLQSDRATG